MFAKSTGREFKQNKWEISTCPDIWVWIDELLHSFMRKQEVENPTPVPWNYSKHKFWIYQDKITTILIYDRRLYQASVSEILNFYSTILSDFFFLSNEAILLITNYINDDIGTTRVVVLNLLLLCKHTMKPCQPVNVRCPNLLTCKDKKHDINFLTLALLYKNWPSCWENTHFKKDDLHSYGKIINFAISNTCSLD